MQSNLRREIPLDLIAGALFLVVGVATLVAIPAYVVAGADDFEVGPRYVPRMMGSAIVLLSTFLIIRTLFVASGPTTTKVAMIAVLPTMEALGVLGLIVLWLLGLRITRYLVVSPVVVVLGLLLFRVRAWVHYTIGIAFAVAVWATFTFILGVRLP